MQLRRNLTSLAFVLLAGCDVSDGGTYARRVESPNELIGGPKAVGTIGDWLIGNQRIRLVLQDQGWSRGFGIFGGGIIDADIVRPGQTGSADGGNGRDNFGELFPALFLQAFDVSPQKELDFSRSCTSNDDCNGEETCERGARVCVRDAPAIEIVRDGSEGGEAILRTRAAGGDFIFMVSSLLDLALPQDELLFETDYVVRPGARHVEIIGRIKNNSAVPQQLDGGAFGTLLQTQFGVPGLQMPIGEVVLFGDGNSVFAPGSVKRPDRSTKRPIGFDLRFAMEDAYRVPRSLPALPGLVIDFLATASDDISYGYAAADSDRNYVWMNQDQYAADPEAKVSKHSLLVPFLIDAFTGAFQEVPPDLLQPGEAFEYKRYFILGDGDIASIRDELFKIRGTPTGSFEGIVRNQQTGAAEEGARVLIYDDDGRPYSEVHAGDDGRFKCRIEAGAYHYVVMAEGRWPFPNEPRSDGSGVIASFPESTRFVIDAKGGRLTSLYRDIRIPSASELLVDVRDPSGRGLPAKVTVVGHYDAPAACKACVGNCDDVCAAHRYVFDFSLGEERHLTDLNWRDDSLRRGDYIEAQLYSTDGLARGTVRPSLCGEPQCAFDVYVSRGPEYDVVIHRDVVFKAGEQHELSALLRRKVDTTDWVSADFHLHSAGSVDSALPFDMRVRAAAAEGLEIAVATEHNFVVDYDPWIKSLGLQDWLNGIVGIEMSTLEMGHFNAFPIRYAQGTATHLPFVDYCFPDDKSRANRTAFDWVQCEPGEIFQNLRRLGKYSPAETVIQINHPRDSILGYFNQYYLNPYIAQPEEPTNANYSFVEFPLYLRPMNPDTQQFDPQRLSFDFDAIEVFNGKRLDQLHSFVVPSDAPASVVGELRDVCDSGHPDNGPGRVLLKAGGYPSNPGAVDDWFHLLNNGHRFAATGNSDSHNLSAEVGTPRTYLYLPPGEDGSRDLDVGAISELEVVEALRGHRAVATNGPMLDMQVLTRCPTDADAEAICSWRLGETVNYGESAVDKDVEILLSVRSAPWIDVTEVRLYANGVRIETLAIPEGERDGQALDDNLTFPPLVRRFQSDTILVAEAVGRRNLFPMVAPKEEPPANISEALGGITGSLGFSLGANDGFRGPSYVQRVTPYAITNPIWLNIDASVDGDGQPTFDPPGNLPGPAPAPTAPGFCDNEPCFGSQICNTSVVPARCECPAEEALTINRQARTLIGPLLLAPPKAGQHFQVRDIRKIFHAHSH